MEKGFVHLAAIAVTAAVSTCRAREREREKAVAVTTGVFTVNKQFSMIFSQHGKGVSVKSWREQNTKWRESISGTGPLRATI